MIVTYLFDKLPCPYYICLDVKRFCHCRQVPDVGMSGGHVVTKPDITSVATFSIKSKQ